MASKQVDPRTFEQLEKETAKLVDDSLKKATTLLDQIVDRSQPFEGFVVLTLALAVLARSMDMPRQTLLEGVGAAFDSVEEVGRHDIH